MPSIWQRRWIWPWSWGGSLEMIIDLRLQDSDLLAEGSLDAGEAFCDERIAEALAAVALGLEEALQVTEAAQQAAQYLLGGTGWLPGWQGPSGAEAGDAGGIEPIGFVAAAQAASVVLDAARVGQMKTIPCRMEFSGHEFIVAAGGFEHG
jgi:hypothetical protein